MKLRNKRSGEVVDVITDKPSLDYGIRLRVGTCNYYYDSLAEVNRDWEDADD